MEEDNKDIIKIKALEALEKLEEHDNKKTLTIRNDNNNNSNQHFKAHKCVNCGTMSTPLWRRTQNGLITCNACGLYLKANKTHRPINLKKPPNLVSLSRSENSAEFQGLNNCNHQEVDIACTNCQYKIIKLENNELNPSLDFNSSLDSDSNVVVVACFNCQSTVTPLWRRDPSGNTICNACGLYFKIHGISRPVKLKKSVIRRRARKKIDNKIDNKIGNKSTNRIDNNVDKIDNKIVNNVDKIDDKIDNKIYNDLDKIDDKIDTQFGNQVVNKNKNTKIVDEITNNVLSIDVTGYKINKANDDRVVERRKAIKLTELLN